MINSMKNTEKIIATTPLELSKFLGKKKLIITGEWCNEYLNYQVIPQIYSINIIIQKLAKVCFNRLLSRGQN